MHRFAFLIWVMVVSAFAGDAGYVEEQVVKLVREKKWDEAVEKAKMGVEENPGDWRLRYFYGILLQQSFREDEALVIFRELFEVEGELPRLDDLDKRGMDLPKYRQHFDVRNFAPREFLKWKDYWLDYQGRLGFDYENTHKLERYFRWKVLFVLPRSASELRYQTGVRVFGLLEGIPDPKERMREFKKLIKGAKGEYRRFLRMQVEPGEVIRELKERIMSDADPIPATKLFLALLSYSDRFSAEAGAAALARISKSNPIFVLENLHKFDQAGLIKYRQGANVGWRVFEDLKDDEKIRALQFVPMAKYYSKYDFNQWVDRKRHVAAIKAEYLRLNVPILSVGRLKSLLNSTIRDQNAEEAVRLLNLAEPMMERASSIYYGRPSGKMEGSMTFIHRPPSFPPRSVVSHLFRLMEGGGVLWSLQGRHQVVAPDSLERWEQLSRVSAVDLAEGNRSAYFFLKPVVDEIMHRPLRAAFYQKLGMTDELRQLIREFELSENYAELRCAAGFAAGEGKWRKCFDLLVRLRGLTPSYWAEDEVDIYLYVVGGKIVGQGEELVGLDLYLKAAESFGGSKYSSKRDWEIRQLRKGDPKLRPSWSNHNATKRNRVSPIDRMKFLWKSGENERAYELLIRVLEDSIPKRVQPPSGYLRALGKLDQISVEVLLNHPLVKASADPDFLRLCAALVYEKGEKEEAKKMFDRASKLNSKSVATLAWRFLEAEESERDWSVFEGVGSEDLVRRLVGVSESGGVPNRVEASVLKVVEHFVKHLPEKIDESEFLRWVFGFCGKHPESATVILKKLTNYPHLAESVVISISKLRKVNMMEREVAVSIANEGVLKSEGGDSMDHYLEYLLRMGLADLKSTFSKEVLEKLKKAAPRRYRDYLAAGAMAKSEGDAASLYRRWREGLTEDAGLRLRSIKEFTAWLVIHDVFPGAWTVEHQALLSDSERDCGVYRVDRVDVQSWLLWSHRKLGQKGVSQALMSFAEVLVGPSSEWWILKGLRWNEAPAPYVKGVHEFWMLLMHLKKDEALHPLIEMAFEGDPLSDLNEILRASRR